MSNAKWDDLAPRVISGVAMIAIGLLGVWLGGLWFHALIAGVAGLMVWELVSMLDSARSRSQYALAGATFASAMIAAEVPPAYALPLLMLPAMLGFARMERRAVTYAVFSVLIMLASFGMMALRDDLGLVWMAWFLLVVVVTDIAGYFAGRLIGGPKFWPKVSPKKTWSGTVAGWAGAAVVGLVFAKTTLAGTGLVGISIAMSMASQIGDIAESALKRREGVKDSSALIPGHGGLLDRFDGMLGAAVFLVIAGQIIGFPPVAP